MNDVTRIFLEFVIMISIFGIIIFVAFSFVFFGHLFGFSGGNETEGEWLEKCFDLGNSTQFIPYVNCTLGYGICDNTTTRFILYNDTVFVVDYNRTVISGVWLYGNGNIAEVECPI